MAGIKIVQSDLDFILKQLRLPNNTPVLPIDMTGIRDVSGVGNNVSFPSWGATDTPFLRLFEPNFSNYTPNTFLGFGNYANSGVASSYATRDINLQDATPRQISNIVNNSDGLSNLELQDNPLDTPGGRLNPLTGLVNPLVYSGYLSLVGQFFDHGLDFVQKGADGYVVVKLDANDPLLDPTSPSYDPRAVNAPFQVISRTNTVHVDINAGSTDSLINALGLVQQRYTSPTDVLHTTVDVAGVQRAASYVVGTGTIALDRVVNSGASGVFQLNNVAINIGANSTGADLINAINAQTNYTGVSASFDAGHLRLTYLDGESINRISPFIDLSQQYGSVASQTAFLREFDVNGQITGHLAGHTGPGLGMATWADIKANALRVGVTLHDIDVQNIPEVRLAADGSPYLGTGSQLGMWLVARDKVTGNVYYVKNSDIAANGANQVLDANGAVVGNLSILSTLKLQVVNHAFLDDIAHEVDFTLLNSHGDFVNSGSSAVSFASLNAHYIAGDGRTNENIGLTSIHDIFHSEHEKVLESLKALNDQRIATDVTYVPMTGEELFQGAKLVVEMEYQHMIFGEFARKLSPNIGAFAAYDPTENPAISQEFANAVYRLGHSMLTDTIDTAVLNGGQKATTQHDLYDVFLNPTAYSDLNTAGPISAAGQVAMGMSSQVGNAIDQWVTDTLRNKLVGLPLDLAAANIVRGRDTGLPTFEEARDAVYAQTGMIQFAQHLTWYDFAGDLIHPETVVDFIEAYADLSQFSGTSRERAIAASESLDFMNGGNTDFRNVDLWVGGLAEAKETNGMLGTLFDFVFATQMSHLQNNDRFYYLGRLVGTDLLAQIESQLLVDIVQRNSGATHIYNDIFSVADNYVEMSQFSSGAPTHSLIATSGTAADAGYASNGAFYGDNGEYTDARGVNSPNGVGKASEMIGGTGGNDKIFALDGNDSVWADGGNDTVDGGNGNDFIHGGEGNDKLDDFGGDDLLWGDAGNDTVNGGAGLDQVFGGDGNDDVYGSDGGDIVDGGSNNDLMFGDWGRSPTLATGVVAQYLHFDRAAGTSTISTSSTALSVNDAVVLINGNMDALGGADVMTGGDGNDVMFGGGGGDAIDGSDGNDTIMGGGGADGMLGGLGNDLFLADANDFAFNNTMDGGDGFDTASYELSVRAVSLSLANAGLAIVPPGTNVLDAFINVEGLIGSKLNDTLMGSDFDNVIEGLAGNDTIDGGLGVDMVSYRNASVLNKGVTINLGASVQSNAAAGVGVDTLLNIEGVVGTIYNDSLTGNTLDNIFEGLAGNDSLFGGVGNDTASYVGASALASLSINLGSTGATVGTGTTNSNLVQTQTGVALAEVGSDIFSSIENVIGGSGNDRIIGNGAANVIDGGPAGNDNLNGGAGIDTLSYASSLSSVRVNLSTNTATGSGTDTIINFENVTGSNFNDSLTGDATANVIIGGLGDDAMYGLAGNDMYVIRDAAEMGVNEVIVDTAGTDEIRYTQVAVTAGLPLAASTLTLSDRISGVERVVIEAGLGAVTYTVAGVVTGSAGIAAVNVDASAVTAAPLIIVGNAGNNILGGTSSAGNDTLVGGLGNDTYVVDRATDVILEGNALATEIDTVNVDYKASGTYTLGANVENGTVVSVDTTLLVNITGNAALNILTGNAGDNRLDGLVGADTMVGGLGDDTYVVDALDTVLENPGEGNDTILAAITYSLAAGISAAGTPTGSPDVENLTLTGVAAINGTGNDLNNVITGNSAINTLNGGLGDDTLVGGAGNDIYVVDSLNDVIIENAGEGTDTVQIGVTYVLTAANVENITLTGTGNIDATGNSGSNIITGNSGNNILDGGLGSDTLIGGTGNDTYIINDIFDSITEAANAGTDTVWSSASSYTLGANLENLNLTGVAGINGLGNTLANVINGNSGNNSILGDAGNDTLTGGLGADSLQGGAGGDFFVFTSSADSTTIARDMIMDFVRGALNTGDKINLSGIDANSIGGTGNDAFLTTLLASSGNFTANSQLRYWNDGTYTYLEGNTDNIGSTAEFSVQLVGVFTTLTGSATAGTADIIV